MSDLDPERLRAAVARVHERLISAEAADPLHGVFPAILREFLGLVGGAAGFAILVVDDDIESLALEATAADPSGAIVLWLHDLFMEAIPREGLPRPLAGLATSTEPLLLGYEPRLPAIDNLMALPLCLDGQPAAVLGAVNSGFDRARRVIAQLEPFLAVARVATAQLLRLRVAKARVDATERGLRRLQTFADASPGLAYLADERRRIRWLSAGFVRSFAVDATEVIGRHEEELIPASLVARSRAIDEQVREGEEAVQVLEPALGPDGEIHWWQGAKFPVEGEHGQTWIGGAAIDVTETVRAAEVLREREGDLNEIQEIGRIGRWSWAVQRDHISWDAHFERLCGRASRDDDDLASLLDLLHPDDIERTRRALEELVREGGTRLQLEHRLLADGDVRHVAVTIRVRREGEAGPTLMAVAQDVSERRSLERRQRALETKAHEYESLAVLLGGMSGEFEELLVSVLGNAGIALDDLPADGLAAACILDIEVAAERASELVSKLRSFGGGPSFDHERLDLSSLIASFAGPIHAVVPEQVSVRLSLHPELPTIEGDVARLRHLVVCLVSNGAEAVGDSGELVLATGVDVFDHDALLALAPGTSLAPGRYVWLMVRDSGPGIDSAQRQQIFEPFFSTKATGRGLGLAAALGIAQAHGGGIMVEARPGHGGVFRVLFPPLLGSSESGERWLLP